MPSLPRRISLALVLLVFALSVYRARTQPFTVDEAHTFRLFIDRDLATMAKEFDACNHVLHTLLTKFFRWAIGMSEFELRLSSLAGCLLYLAAVYRLSVLCFDGRWVQPLTVALLTLNPLVMDFFVVSRGYGLALGLFLWCLYCASAYWTRGRDQRWLWRAGVLAGLAIAANLTLLVPAAALGGLMLMMAVRDRAAGVWQVIDSYAGPAIVVAFVFLVLPLLRAAPGHFYYGSPTFRHASGTLVRAALIKSPEPRNTDLFNAVFPAIDRVLVPLVFFAIVAGGAVALYSFVRGREPVPFRLVPYLLFSGTLAGSALLIWVLRRFGVPYPMGRTGLYFIPLLLFPLVYGSVLLARTRFAKLRWAGSGLALLLVALFVTQIDTRFFTEWQFDGTGPMLRRLRDEHQANWRENRQVVLGVSRLLEPTVDYYRLQRNIHWLAAPVRAIESTSADYYLLMSEDFDLLSRPGIETVHRDELSGVVLARRRR